MAIIIGNGKFLQEFTTQGFSASAKMDATLQLSDSSGTIASLRETYYPDADGKCYITNIRDFIAPYMQPPMPQIASKEEELDVKFGIIYHYPNGTNDQKRSDPVVYSNVRTDWNNALTTFRVLSRHKNITLMNGMPMLYSYILPVRSNVTAKYYVYCKSEGNADLDYRFEQDLVPSSVAHRDTVCMTMEELEELAEESDVEFDPTKVCRVYILFYENGTRIDEISFEVEQNTRPCLTQFLYNNCFGVPEILNFVGRETENVEATLELGLFGGQYINIDSDETIAHTVRSGAITKSQYNAIVDMMHSEYIMLIKDVDNLERIAILSHEIGKTDNNGSPISVSLKYRVSDEVQRVFERE